jgi:GNAT superfamily N-acetyltransferase
VRVHLDPGTVRPRLLGAFGRETYLWAESCPSTQRLPPGDAPHGTVAVAEHQTEGRGRLGRTWVDEPGASLLCSVVLRPTRPVADWPQLTAVAGEAAAEAVLRVSGRLPAIKPPNDLLLDGGKLAGILAEAQEGRIVLGMGVNVGSAPHEGAVAVAVDRAELLVEWLYRLERAFAAWDMTRRATGADAERLLGLFSAARAAQDLPFPPRDSPWLERVLALETWLHPQGFAALSEGTLEYLYVTPEAQGQGIGAALLGLAKAQRPQGFDLWVFQHLDRSRRFYERHGLELVEETDGSGNMERLPDARYRWAPASR